MLIVSFFSIFFNTGVWINNKNDFLDRAYKNGLNNYLHIFEITFKGFKSFFFKYEEMNIDLPYENLIILEQNKKEMVLVKAKWYYTHICVLTLSYASSSFRSSHTHTSTMQRESTICDFNFEILVLKELKNDLNLV